MFEDDKFNEEYNNDENITPEGDQDQEIKQEVPFEEIQKPEADQAYTSAAAQDANTRQDAEESQETKTYQSASVSAPEHSEPAHASEKPEGDRAHTFGSRIVGIVAAALLFGVVAGLTMFGVNGIAENISGRSTVVAQTETAAPREEVTVSHAEPAAIPATNAIALDVSDIVENAMPSIVAIDNTMVIQQQLWFGRSQEYEASSSGSGIIVGQNDDELLIATNNHVVESSKDITVTFIDDTQAPAAVKGTDSDMDLAVIAVSLADIEPETRELIKVATIGNSDDLRVGEGVIAIGNALGYGQSVTTGVISALDREVETDDSVTRNLLQTDAAINPGNSGGALLNMRGELIGINSAKYSGTAVEGMGYAIPISAAEDILNELMNKRTRVEVDEARQGYLGIQGTNIDENTAVMYDMPRGVYVFKILDGGAAASSDLQEKDIITKFDGQTVKTMAELKEMLTYYEAGSTVDLTVERLENGEYVERTVEITLGMRDLEEG